MIQSNVKCIKKKNVKLPLFYLPIQVFFSFINMFEQKYMMNNNNLFSIDENFVNRSVAFFYVKRKTENRKKISLEIELKKSFSLQRHYRNGPKFDFFQIFYGKNKSKQQSYSNQIMLKICK